jgi:hypothetical protein
MCKRVFAKTCLISYKLSFFRDFQAFLIERVFETINYNFMQAPNCNVDFLHFSFVQVTDFDQKQVSCRRIKNETECQQYSDTSPFSIPWSNTPAYQTGPEKSIYKNVPWHRIREPEIVCRRRSSRSPRPLP